MDIRGFKRRFDPLLKRLLRERVHGIHCLTQDRTIRQIADYAEKIVMAGGKRVRPYLAFVSYKTAGGKKDNEALNVFVGLELFHAFALVHDDIMDRGATRHGIKTAHRLFGDNQAILVGDLLFNWAADCLNGTAAYPIFSRMIDEVITGQMLDVDSMNRAKVSGGMIEERYRLKTASYTFVRPLQIGIALAHGEERKAKKLMRFAEAYGIPLGMAFQIQDDLLDLVKKPDETGKTAFSDLRDGQHTLFTQFIVGRGSSSERRELKKFFANGRLSEKDRPAIARLFAESGAIEHGRTVIEAYFDEAEQVVKKTFAGSVQAKPFYDLIVYIRQRGH